MTAADRPSLEERIRFPQSIPVREVWPSEPYNFTPWLAANLHVLDFLGLGQLTLDEPRGIEVSIPGTDRALDILTLTPTGEKVAIENQYNRADHDHLTRGLAYAVGLQAQALVIVAEEHRGEFRAIADYLNRVAEQAKDPVIHIYLVEVSVEMIGDYVVPRFTIVASPNPWLIGANDTAERGQKLTLDEFIAAVSSDVRDEMAQAIAWWSEQPGGTLRFAASSISLDRPNPAKSRRPLSHILLWAAGTFTIQRGYLREAGIVTDDDLEEFDALISLLFPTVKNSAKGYFLNGSGAPLLTSVQELFRWTEDHSAPRATDASPSLPPVSEASAPDE